MPRPEWDALHVAWDSIRAALAACGVTRIVLDLPGRDGIHGLCRLAWWLVKTSSYSGIGHSMKTLKRWSSDLRLWAVTGVSPGRRRNGLAVFLQGRLRSLVDSDVKAVQMSYLGRALPEGSPGVQQKALRAHFEALTSRHRTDPELLRRAEEFGLAWGEAHLRAPLPGTLPLAGGACLESFRSQGGIAGALVPYFGEVEQLRSSEEWRSRAEAVSRVKQTTECHRDLAVRDSFVRDALIRDIREMEIPSHEAHVVPERGWKSRVVTMGPAALVAYGHYLRSWLFSGLKRDGRCLETLEGGHRDAVEKVAEGPRKVDGRQFLSADLTSASDLLPLDLVASVVRGLVRSAPYLPEDAIHALWLLSGPQRVVWRPLGITGRTERGILMGLPTTWCLLSITQLFWASEGWRSIWSGVPRAPPNVALPSYTPATAICGDDLVAWWPIRAIQAYEAVATRCGAEFSAGKHARSSKYAIFVEEIYKLRLVDLPPRIAFWESSRLPRFELGPKRHGYRSLVWRKKGASSSAGLVGSGIVRIPTIPLRGLVRPRRLPGTGTHEVPWWAALGPAAAAVADSSGQPGKVRRVLRVLWPSAWRWARERGFAVTLPRELGGFGLPQLRGRPDAVGRLPSVFSKGVAGYLYASRPGVRPPDAAWGVFRYSSWRTMARESADWKLGKRGILSRPGRVPWGGKAVPLGDIRVTEDIVTALARELTALLGLEAPRASFRVPPRSLALKVRKFYARILRRVRWGALRGLSPGAPRRALLKKLQGHYQWIWWTSLAAASEGFILGLPAAAKRDLSVALGWAKVHPRRGPSSSEN